MGVNIGSSVIRPENSETFYLRLGPTEKEKVLYQFLLTSLSITHAFENTLKILKAATQHGSRMALAEEDKLIKKKKTDRVSEEALTKKAVALVDEHFGSFRSSRAHSLPPRNSSVLSLAIASMKSLFSTDSLSAVFIPTLPYPTIDTLQAAFIHSCKESTDYQFLPVKCQLEEAQRKLGREMKSGDYFITKHSNLLCTHLAFHICCNKQERKEAPYFLPSDFLQGMSNAIGMCCQYGVAILTFPIPLISELSIPLDTKTIAKQATLLIDLIRAILSEHPTNSIRYVRIVFPLDVDYHQIKRTKTDALFVSDIIM